MLAIEFMNNKEDILNSITSQFKCSVDDIDSRIKNTLVLLKSLEKENGEYKTDSLINTKIYDQGDNFVFYKLDNESPAILKGFSDKITHHHPEKMHTIINIAKDKVSVVVRCPKATELNASNIIKSISDLIGGRGGGKAEYAQAGGTITNNYTQVFEAIKGQL